MPFEYIQDSGTGTLVWMHTYDNLAAGLLFGSMRSALHSSPFCLSSTHGLEVETTVRMTNTARILPVARVTIPLAQDPFLYPSPTLTHTHPNRLFLQSVKLDHIIHPYLMPNLVLSRLPLRPLYPFVTAVAFPPLPPETGHGHSVPSRALFGGASAVVHAVLRRLPLPQPGQ